MGKEDITDTNPLGFVPMEIPEGIKPPDEEDEE